MKRTLKTLLTLIIVMACAITTNIGMLPTTIEKSNVTVYAATANQEKALEDAKSYLKESTYSKKGLKEQLEFDGYTKKEANYAVNNCGANWKKQAKKEAKNLIRLSLDEEWKKWGVFYYSKKSMIETLKYHGYTKSQAKFGAKKCGANWKKEAVIAAEILREDYSEDEVRDLLKEEGFTKAQINHAISKVEF